MCESGKVTVGGRTNNVIVSLLKKYHGYTGLVITCVIITIDTFALWFTKVIFRPSMEQIHLV
jgi:hypothetical protein